MKIENKYVKIKNGKTYDFRNTITNDYLKLFNKSQYDNDYKKMSITDKELKYCYIKTDEELNGSISSQTTYYNLINVNDIASASQNFTISDNWINYNNTAYMGAVEDIVFNNTGYVESGNDYKLLFAIKNINAMYLDIYINDDIYIKYQNRHGSEWLGAGDDNAQTSWVGINKQNGVYYLAFHLHNVQDTSDLFSLNVDYEGGGIVDIQYSIIKESNNEDYIEQIQASDYQYSPYIDLTDLAGQYNYRLPVVSDSAKGSDIVEVDYTYNNVSGYAKSDGSSFEEITNINDIANKKILQLAFGNNNTIYAFVDVSVANIVMLENEALYIYRKDTLSSDAKYTGNHYPAHLSPLGVKIDDYVYYGELWSIGFGFTKGIINEEYLISENPITEIDDYTFQVELQRGYNETLTPSETLYPSENLYPVFEVHAGGIYPSQSLYPSENLYPQMTDYKYLIYKYRLYRISGNDIIESEYYYTMSYYTEHKGQIYMNTKLERS